MADEVTANQTTEDVKNETPESEQRGAGRLTRREWLIAAGGGGAALVAGALGGGAVGSLSTRAQYEVKLAENQAKLSASDIELAKLRTLVGLYENLEKVGIDAVIAAGMNVVRGSLDAVKSGVGLVRNGITATQNGIKAFQEMLDTLHNEVNKASQGLNDLMTKFLAAEALVVRALGTALPLTESIRNFFNAILDKVPFGLGDNIRKGVDGLVILIQGIPTAVDVATGQLIQPLTNTFFPPTGTAPVKTTLLDPIAQNLLQPLDKFLGDVETLLTKWQTDFTTPVQAALDQRQQIRQQIADYRKQNAL